jgi:2-oxoisovalerate dehydrogenase E1 component
MNIPIPQRSVKGATAKAPAARQINRAEVVDRNFVDFVQQLSEPVQAVDLTPFGLDAGTLKDLFESQVMSRQLDLMARKLRLENKVFYTIGSSGHEGNALLGRLTRHTDPAFLHYRSGAFMMERARQLPEIDPVFDTALSFAASKQDPASGGRHKVWGSKPLWVLPQTSTIASHLPKAVGTALGIELGKRSPQVKLPVPEDALVVCNFGDASSNHSTAQGAFNAAQWASYQGLDVPVLFVCEDNNLGISVKTPPGWVENNFRHRPGMRYFQADGLDIVKGYQQVRQAVDYCRQERKPVFLHMNVVRLMGHAGTDFEVDYRSLRELEATEARDPLLKTAQWLVSAGVMSPAEILAMYEGMRERCLQAARQADRLPRLKSAKEVTQPLAPFTPEKVYREAARAPSRAERVAVFGSEDKLPENQPPRHMAVQINNGLKDLMLKYPQAIVFGEDVAQKGGVYTITKGLYRHFSPKRVFNTLLDEQTILGLAQGYSYMGLLPIPEIQYLAYFHNACDQIRGEASSLQFFSNKQFANPMMVRIAGLGYQKGFGGHFHNDNSITALRDIPGLLVACPARGDDAVRMMRSLMALSHIDGRVSIFLEPIALYMRKDLYAEGDGLWNTAYPPVDSFIPIGEPGIHNQDATDALIITYGNGVPMSLQAAREIEKTRGLRTRIMDLRWLQPLNREAIVEQVAQFDRVLIVDEGRASASVGEGVVAAIVDSGMKTSRIERITGLDSFTPLGEAASLVLPSVSSITRRLADLLECAPE